MLIAIDFRIVVKQTFRKSGSKGLFLIVYFEKSLTHLDEVEYRVSIFEHFRVGSVVYSRNIYSVVDASAEFFQYR